MKPAGYLVFEWCDDYEQALGLKHDARTPKAGVLDWISPAAIFSTRAAARAAIDRTEHYRLAHGLTGADSLPEKRQCKVVTARFVDAELN